MTMRVSTAHRVAAALAVIFLALAVIAGSRYYQTHNGWDIEAADGQLMVFMLLVLGSVLAASYAAFRPGARNPQGQRKTSVVWSLALILSLFFTWHVIDVAHRWQNLIGTSVTSPQELEAFIADESGVVRRV